MKIQISGPDFGGHVAWGADYFAKKYRLDGAVLPLSARSDCVRTFGSENDARAYLALFPSIRIATTEAEREPAANEIVAWFES